MAQAQLGAVVRHLRRLAGSATVRELPDAQLLQRFAGRHEEDAFAALVERHGRLVWSACWQVLHHEQDAEDAFQATFLVLARQAGSIRNGRTLASWLYRVAYRTALRARLAKSKRHAHERQSATMPHDKHGSELAWRELQAVLVEELDRLPDKYRCPFLLCCLEGKSKAEAAKELGWKEGTVSGRLALARKQMQQRLARRGVALSALLCGMALAPENAKAMLTGSLLDNTVRAAVLFAGSNNAAELTTLQAAALARGVLKTMALSKLKSIGLVLLVIGLVASGAGAFTHQALANRNAGPSAEPRADSAPSSQLKARRDQMEMRRPDAGGARPETPRASDPKNQVALTGQVLGADGKPVAGAHVAVVAALKLPDQGISLTMNGMSPEAEVLGVGKADETGRWRVPVPKKAFERAYEVEILAGARGYGLAGQPLKLRPKPADTVVRLQPSEDLRVRLIDLEGLPAAGVKVSMVRLGKLSYSAGRQYTMAADTIEPAPIFFQDFGARDAGKMMERKPAQKDIHAIQFVAPPSLPFWPQPAVTDAQGRCTLHGLQRGQALAVQVSASRFATQILDIEPSPETANEVSLALGAPHLLEGTVRDAASGKPVPNARIHIDTFPDYFGGFGIANDPADDKGRRYGGNYFVSMGSQINRMDVQADERGHYRVNPFMGNTQVLTVTAPAGQPYLALRKDVGWPKGAVRHEVNVALTPGVTVQGKVVEVNGKPVAGCRIDFWSKGVKPPNPFKQQPQFTMVSLRSRTGADGSFQTVLPPGRWYALANGPREDYLWQKLLVEDLVEIDPKVRIPAPPVPKAPENSNSKETGKDDNARLDATTTLTPEDLVPGVKEGGKHYFRPDGWVQIDVRIERLTPEAKITLHRSALEGRLLSADGSPAAKARMYYRRRTKDWRVPASEVSNGSFRLPLPDLDTQCRVLFLDAENGQGAAADFSGKQSGGEPAVIRLSPCGSATVRFVDSQGKPLANYRPLVWALVPPVEVVFYPKDMMEIQSRHLRADGSVWLGHMDRKNYETGPVTAADGRVTLPNLIPGATYRISQFSDMRVDFTVQSAKNTTVGDIVIQDPSKIVEIPK
jgi:RNA polymerase sigma factor (sigma-70 family)